MTDAFDPMSDRLRLPAVPLTGGAFEIVIPPEVGMPPIVTLRYVMYRTEGGSVFFDFVAEDVKDLAPPVQAWLWARRSVLKWMMWERVRCYFKIEEEAPLPREVDLH